jgi:uncharacterized phiE125 gp8 family phage protein
MALRLIAGPTVEPVTLAEAKAHLRIDHTDDDTLIAMYLAAARNDCEEWTARAFVAQTWELVLDEFPADEILIPRPPLQSVESIKYDDADGIETTLANTEYVVDRVSQPGWVVPSLSGWPTSTFEGINSIRIRYVAGYGSLANSPADLTENIPGAIKAAILLQLGRLYENREDVIVGTSAVKLPIGAAEWLLRQYRVALGFA